jgi:signal transduction histidine kinase/CheY-like chemotaxis protein
VLPLHQHYTPALVVLSVVIGILASYTALDLSGRIYDNTGRERALWLFGVALTMGVGIWSMHFVGMLALSLPTPVHYLIPHLLSSMVFAIGAAAFALWIAVRPTVRQYELVAAAIVMGIAIAGMHYIGMAGMHMSARIEYDSVLFWLSIGVAVVVSYVALSLTRRLRVGTTARVRAARVIAAIVMGLAVAGMHYTGMAAAHFMAMPGAVASTKGSLPSSFLAGLIAVASILLVGLALLAAMLDRLVRSRLVEAQLRAEKDAAVETNRVKSEFLSNMSHELRTPLNSIIGFSNILLKNKAGNLRESDTQQLSRIAANGKHLLGLINEVLDLSKIEAGKVELEMTWVDVTRLVSDTIEEMLPQATGMDVRLVAEIPEDAAPLRADVVRVKQILVNLVSNAIKFTRGGRVTVRITTDTASRRPIRIDVIDTGIGILKDRLQTVFEAFRQADASTTRQYGGTGLGLTITRSLAELMGWTVEVSSEIGVGTTFSVVLEAGASQDARPRAAVDTVAMPVIAPAITPPKSDRSFVVLIIDDEPDARDLLRHELEELQCDVFAATSADEGIALARTLRPDLITLDVMMPVKNGWQALRELKADADLRHIPVAIISVVAEEARRKVVGAVDFFDKPVTRDKLVRLIPGRGSHEPAPRVLLIQDGAADIQRYQDLADAGALELEIATDRTAADRIINRSGDLPDLVVLDGARWNEATTTWVSALHEQHATLRVAVVVAEGNETGEAAGLAAAVLRKGEGLTTDLDALLGAYRGRVEPAA